MDTKQSELLTVIVSGTQSAGYAMVNKNTNALKALVAAALVELNPSMTKGMDIAARATDTGINALSGNTAPVQQETQPAMTTTTQPKFAILKGIALPPRAAGRTSGPRTSKYAFGELEIGDSFFVPKSDNMKNPARSLASTASAQSAGTVKRFAVRTYTHEGAEGALVQRIADASEVAPPKPRKAKAAPQAA